MSSAGNTNTPPQEHFRPTQNVSGCPTCQGLGFIAHEKNIGAVPAESPSQEPARASAAPQDGWLTMRQAATKLRCSYYHFSRKWRAWGLHPSVIGKLFREEELDQLLRRNRVTSRGRPRKQKGTYA